MKRVLVLVEGPTEERFVKDVLCPHIWPLGIDTIPTLVKTKRVKCGPDFKGGVTVYQKVENDLRRLLQDTGAEAVTTFIDYYALPTDFPGMSNRPDGPSILKVRHVEAEWERKIYHERFHAFLMVHEFEALLFSKPDEISTALYEPFKLPQLMGIRLSFATPEEINDNPQTAPSKRIAALLPAYDKALHGPILARRIGLETIRRECSHFNEWLTWLEGL